MKLFCMCLHVYLRNSVESINDVLLELIVPDFTMCSLCKTGVKHKAQDLTIWKKKIIGVF